LIPFSKRTLILIKSFRTLDAQKDSEAIESLMRETCFRRHREAKLPGREQKMQHITPLALHQAELQRIQEKLAKVLSRREARELAKKAFVLALEVDEDIRRILQDPRFDKLYDYDGQFFTPRGTSGFHTAFDGLHLLSSLSNTIDIIFKTLPKSSAIECLLDDLDQHRWVAKRRRMNWEECGTLFLVPEETIGEIITAQKHQLAQNPPPLSDEEQAFFRSFEKQLEQIRV
jgi:hypothetical protein